MYDIKWDIYKKPSDVWNAQIADISEAKSYILLEQYIFTYGDVGKRFVDTLRRKLKEGVQVVLLLDTLGSYSFVNSGIAKELQGLGAEIYYFNPVGPWRLHTILSWFFRDHRKIVIIDGTAAYTGGVGVNDAMEHWRDLMIRIEGPVVSEMENAFWGLVESVKQYRFVKFPSPKQLGPGFNFVINSPHRRQRFYYYRLVDAIRAAQRRIYLCTPYFVPDLRIIRLLQLAAKRGVDVRLVLPERSDHRWLDLAASSYFGFLFRSGARIFTYQKTVLHSKYAIMDDDWTSVGSTNLDNLSLTFNYEGNLISSNPHFNREFDSIFFEDLEGSRELSYIEWKNRSFTYRFLELLTWPLHKFF